MKHKPNGSSRAPFAPPSDGVRPHQYIESFSRRGPLSSFLHMLSERTIVALIYLCGVSSIIFVFSIFFFIFKNGAPFLWEHFDFMEFFFSDEWYPTSETNKRYGILALFLGTASVTVVAMFVAVPFGIFTAVFIAEFCGSTMKEILKVTVEFLAAVPSVVWGFVGLLVLNPLIIKVTGAPIGLNVLNGGIVVGLMSVPVIVSIAEDAIRSVPDRYREAAEALGATNWQIAYKVVIPAAKNGLLAAVLLGVGRAVGETMAVLMATGNSINIPFDAEFPFFHVGESVKTLTATIAAELGEAPEGSHHFHVLFVLGIVLFIITFVINITADFIIKGIRKK